ncbi:MAG: glycosyltransferase family 9 protein [Candidatus Omnitrophota bacterium]
MREYKTNCRYFQGDKPCKFHKNEGIYCEACSNFSLIEEKILIIKLAAPGDVLRTTSILLALKKKYPKSRIVWVTKKNALDLLNGNPHIDLLLEYPNPAVNRLWIENFDLVINLDCDFESASLAVVAKSPRKLGFGCSEDGRLIPFNKEAEYWLEMSLFDDVKKANQNTYQEIMLDICGLNAQENSRPVFSLTKEELDFGDNFIKTHGAKPSFLTIGINAGAGSRWPQKKWKRDSYGELIKCIKGKYSADIILLGGPEEIDLNKYLIEQAPHEVINAGCRNTYRQFAGIINICDLIITGDTLALHLAVALEKRIVALFGPTSMAEIDLYGQGEKISAEMDCLSCYKNVCDKSLTCMDALTVEKVFAAVESQLQETEKYKRNKDSCSLGKTRNILEQAAKWG